MSSVNLGGSTYDPLAPLAWMADALCTQTDPEAFFPEQGEATIPATKVCASCDVKEQCLAYALETDQRFGVWGGLNTNARRKLRRDVKLVAA